MSSDTERFMEREKVWKGGISMLESSKSLDSTRRTTPPKTSTFSRNLTDEHELRIIHEIIGNENTDLRAELYTPPSSIPLLSHPVEVNQERPNHGSAIEGVPPIQNSTVIEKHKKLYMSEKISRQLEDVDGSDEHCQLNAAATLADFEAGFDPDSFVEPDSDDSRDYLKYQFSTWTCSQREGIEAIPFADIGAPENAHEFLAQWGQKMWERIELGAQIYQNKHECMRTILTQFFKQGDLVELADDLKICDNGDTTMSVASVTNNIEKLIEVDDLPKEEDLPVSKRAAAIAKAQAAKKDSVATKQSTSDKLSAKLKNKGRKSIMADPPSKAQKPEQGPKPKPEPERQPKGLSISVLPDNSTNPLQNRTIDLSDDEQVHRLMALIAENEAKDKNQKVETEEREQDQGAALDEIKSDDRDVEMETGEDKESKVTSKRLKGKARKNAKKFEKKTG